MEQVEKRGRGRPKKLDGARVHWVVYIRADVSQDIGQIAHDPVREKLKYEARSKIMEEVLDRWIQGQKDQGFYEVPHMGDYPRIRWETYIEPSIAAAVDLLLTPAMTIKVPYGARSRLVEKLLLEWLRARRA